jgi:parallel beta-helix repeat protein
VSVTNSIIEKADSIYVSGSPYANFYGNKIFGCANGIYLYKSSATIEKCEIYDCTFKALFISESSPTIKETKIYDNDVGLYVLDTGGAQAVTLENSEVYGNNYGGKFLAGVLDSFNTTWSQNSILDLSLTNFGGVGSYVYLLNSPADVEKVDVLDTQSLLETGWYLNVQVTNEALSPLFNVSVDLKDSLTHVDSYNTDDEGWVLNAERKEYRIIKSGIFDHLELETTIIAKIESGEGITKQVTMNQTQTHKLIINIKPEISQTLPTINMTEDVPFYDVLDLNDYFSDNEVLEFNYYGTGNLNVTIHPNGSIDIIPEKDWNGKENVTFSAKDSSGTTIWMEMPVDVRAVNDHPCIIDIKLSPTSPVSKQKLSVEYSALDIDGGGGQGILVFIFWYKNGVRQDSYNYQSFVTDTYKGEEWNCEVIASDGIDQSPSYFSDVVTIQNSRPSISDVIINPSVAYTDTPLRSTVKEPYDVDDMSIDYLYQWQKKDSDEWADIESAQTSTLDSSKFVKNDDIRLVVTPFDGTENGESVASTSIRIKNTAPSIEGVMIVPEDPRRGAGFIKAYPMGAYDKDGDQVQYSYKWKLQGWPVPLSTDETLDSNVTVEMDALIFVFIDPFDGDEWGESKNVSFILRERDLDGDEIPDSKDDDIDGDGFNNTWEILVGTDPEDPTSYPEGGNALDTDGDGSPDGDHNNSKAWMDQDDDGDNYPDYNDTFPLDSTEWNDWDKDGIGDNADQDDDNDGYSDDMEIAVGTDPRDPGDYPEEDEVKTKESFWTNFFLFLIIVLILILCGVGVLYVYKQYIMEQPVEERVDRDEEDDFDRTGLLNYLKKGLGSLTAGVGDEDEDVSKDLSDIDLEADLVECSNCQAMVPADEDICPECDAHFLDEEEEEPVMGEPPDMDEELEDVDDEFSLASIWEDEDEEEEKPRKSKKKGKKKGKKKDKKKGKKKGKKKKGKKKKSRKKKRRSYDDDDDDDYTYDDDDDEDEWF